MAYLAMARKWRPKNFEDMVGQDHIAQTIRNAIDGKRISHAYLFTGTRGVGKTTSARILAKALNCEKGPTPIPCDVCDNCKAVNNGSSMDVLEIDGASNNGVENIRELREQVNYAPMNGTYKIYVIDEVHMLSKSAFNALLKTLEEPPPHVVFIFATTEANKLPHTILSRVQRFDFKRISEQNIRERLEYICAQEGIKPQREALEAIARKADGSMRDALSLFDQVYAFSGADLSMEAARKVLGLPRDGMFDGLLRALIQHDQKICFTTLQEAHREGIETSELLVAFGEYLRNMLFARQGVSPGALGLGDARYAELIALAPELRDGDVIRFAKMVSDILAQLKNSANPRLAVELGFARMAALDRVVTLSQVLGQDFAPAIQATREAETSALGGSPGRETPRAPEGASDLSEVKKKSPPDAITPAPESPAPDFSPKAEAPRESSVSDFAAQPSATAVLSRALPAIDPAMPLGGAIEPVYSLPPALSDEEMEPEREMERDMEPDLDPDNPEAPMPVTPPQAVADPESLTVPAQESPAALPEVWPALVAEFMALRPLLGSHLRQTRLEWEAGDAPTLRVTFLERTAFSLIGDDADFRKSIQAFLGSKVPGSREFPVRFALDEAAAEAAKNAAGAAVDLIHIPYGSEDPAKREPIINFIRDIFEGRPVG
ncbi:MAG: polymerase subunit gamma and tau [Fibrobacteres bacterium]|nr:polymerase subunit gamma and tau [Fibrobacterota bacterium]